MLYANVDGSRTRARARHVRSLPNLRRQTFAQMRPRQRWALVPSDDPRLRSLVGDDRPLAHRLARDVPARNSSSRPRGPHRADIVGGAGGLQPQLKILQARDRRHRPRHRSRPAAHLHSGWQGGRKSQQECAAAPANPPLCEGVSGAGRLPNIHRMEMRLARIGITYAMHDAEGAVLQQPMQAGHGRMQAEPVIDPQRKSGDCSSAGDREFMTDFRILIHARRTRNNACFENA